MIRSVLAVAAAVTLLALSACGAGGVADPGAAGAGTAATPSTGGNAADPIAFTAINVETGDVFDGSSLKGHDTIIWFWASWCPICEAESGAFVNVVAEPDFPADVTIIGVAGLSDADQAKGFVDRNGVGQFEHVYDTDGSIWQSFGVSVQPAFAFINDDGTFTIRQGGIGKWDLLKYAKELAAA